MYIPSKRKIFFSKVSPKIKKNPKLIVNSKINKVGYSAHQWHHPKGFLLLTMWVVSSTFPNEHDLSCGWVKSPRRNRPLIWGGEIRCLQRWYHGFHQNHHNLMTYSPHIYWKCHQSKNNKYTGSINRENTIRGLKISF
jgi:hypothetical protein